jgi:hypothetical protein
MAEGVRRNPGVSADMKSRDTCVGLHRRFGAWANAFVREDHHG